MSDRESSSETTPLIADTSAVFAYHNRVTKNYVIYLIYSIILCFALAKDLEETPRLQIYEEIICQAHYAKVGTGGLHGPDCKVKAVEEELALIRGVELFTHLVPTILAIPYGFLANRYGHREIFFLAFVGLSLSEAWGILICWFPKLFPIRLIWTQWIFELIGGGVSVAVSMIYLIVADVTSEESRTNVYYRLHAAQMLSAVIAPALSSYLMSLNVWLPWALSESLLVASTLLTLLLPNITNGGLVSEDSTLAGVAQVGEDVSNANKHGGLPIKGRIIAAIQRMKNTGTFMAANSQVILLLSMSATGVMGLGSLPIMLLQYMRKRYDWTFAEAGYLLSASGAVHLTLLIFVLPYVGYVLLNRLRLSPHAKDRYLVLVSGVVSTAGAFCLGLGPDVGLAVTGIILMSLGAGIVALLRSIVGSQVSAKNISIVFSAMTMIMNIATAIAGPLYNQVFSAGLRLNPSWPGLPYFVAGAMLALFSVAALFVNKEASVTYEDNDEEHM